MRVKKASAQENMTTKANTRIGRLSLGIFPLRRIKGNPQMRRRNENGRIDSGDTRALVGAENSGKVVMGRQIRASAHKTSHTFSRIVPYLGEVTANLSSEGLFPIKISSQNNP
jgi:hypothetical protein